MGCQISMPELLKLTEFPVPMRETTNLLSLKHFNLIFQRMVASSIYSSIFSIYILPIFLTSRGVGFHPLFSTIDLHSLQTISLDGVQWLSNTAENFPMNKSFTSMAYLTLFCPYLLWITKSILRLSFCNPLALVSGLSEVLHYFQLLILKQLKSFQVIYHAFIPISSLISVVVNVHLELGHLPPQHCQHFLISLISQKTDVAL